MRFITDGYYMYVETSAPNRVGAVARLVSPTVNFQSSQQMCVSFYYNMYGDQVDNLNVYAKTGSNLGNAIWTRKGNQGNAWKQASITVNGPTAVNVS